MARPLRIEYPGAVYHVTSRGNARQTIFRDDRDRTFFLDLLGATVDRFRWLCHGYCLMGNHYHLLIETPEGNLSRGMRQLNGVYTQAFNCLHKRPGHLFQGRYKAILVEKDSYLLALCRYIVLNPVAAGMVKVPEDWAWSSYLATAGMTAVPELLTTDWLIAQFASTRRKACDHYRDFVCQAIGQPSIWAKLRGGMLLGGGDFVDRLQSHLSEKKSQEEVPRQQRLLHRPPLDDLLTTEIENRASAARKAHVAWGYTLKEIAGFWGIHYSTVSRMIKKSEEVV